jgi:hypothetical protein
LEICGDSTTEVSVGAAGERVTCFGASIAGAAGPAINGLDEAVAADATSGGAAGAAGLVPLRWLPAGTSNRAAAARVRMYPALYTVSTATELNATRPLLTRLLEPLPESSTRFFIVPGGL